MEIAQIFFPHSSNPEDQIEELTINMRSTKEICEFAAEYFLPEDEWVKMNIQSRNCRSIPDSVPEERYCAWLTQQNDQIKKWLEQASQKSWNVTIFCRTTKMVDDILTFLNDNRIEHWAYYNRLERKCFGKNFKFTWVNSFGESVFVSTHKSSKGLEADCVILMIDKKGINDYNRGQEGDVANNILYVLATRAKKKLYILFTFAENSFYFCREL